MKLYFKDQESVAAKESLRFAPHPRSYAETETTFDDGEMKDVQMQQPEHTEKLDLRWTQEWHVLNVWKQKFHDAVNCVVGSTVNVTSYLTWSES